MSIVFRVAALMICLFTGTGVLTAQWVSQTTNTSNALNAVSFVNTTTGWVAGSDGIALHTTNAGSTWLIQTTNTTNTLYGICFISGTTGWVVGEGGMIKKTADGGGAWVNQTSSTSNRLTGVFFLNSNEGYVVGGSTFLKTTNGGSSWSQTGGSGGNSIFFTNVSTGYKTDGDGISRTTNGGVTWVPQYSGPSALGFVCFPNSSAGYAAAQSGTLIRTTNAGSNWELLMTPTSITLPGLWFTDAATGTLVGGNGMILRTSNGGSTWTNQIAGTISGLRAVQFVDVNNGWAVGDSGTILHTSNGGVTSVVADASGELRDAFVLSRNYPNPFNPSTTIRYSLSHSSFVTLTVYSILGQQVAELVHEERQAGDHDVVFRGDGLASGVYFYRISVVPGGLVRAGGRDGQGGDFVASRRLLLLR